MKKEKVHFICTYNDSHQIYGLEAVIRSNGHTVSLIWYDRYDNPEPYRHESFDDMYNTCLRFAKQNNYDLGYYEAFGQRFYDISFIEIESYAGIRHYGINESEVIE